MEGLNDKRLTQASHCRAPVDEVMKLTHRYRSGYLGWNVKHFYSWSLRDGGKRSYTWVKNVLQKQGEVPRLKKKDTHRRRRERSPFPGMMLHQDGSRHAWVAGKQRDLIVTMDDATMENINQNTFLQHIKKRTYYVLQNRTFLFASNRKERMSIRNSFSVRA